LPHWRQKQEKTTHGRDIVESGWPTIFLAESAFHNAGLSVLDLPLGKCRFALAVLDILMVLIVCGNTCFKCKLRLSWNEQALAMLFRSVST